MKASRLLLVLLVAFLIPASSLRAQGSSAYLSSHGTNAIDAKGVRRRGNDYPGKHPPWLDDIVKSVAPEYPYEDRARHHQGVGLFRLTLDLKAGSVSKVTMLKSTGFSTLDNCAVASFRGSRFKPGKWKEIEMPVTFQMKSGPPPLPAGAVRLPRS